MLAWETVRGDFELLDGCYLDIYVFQTSMSDWRRMVGALRTSLYEVKYFHNGQPTELPIDISEAFPFSGWHERSLSVTLAGVQADCHFFGAEEIEFNIDSREIKGQRELNALFDFMRMLAETVGKDVVLTPEDASETVIFRVRPGIHDVQWQEFGDCD